MTTHLIPQEIPSKNELKNEKLTWTGGQQMALQQHMFSSAWNILSADCYHVMLENAVEMYNMCSH